jgi:hypothetical protein
MARPEGGSGRSKQKFLREEPSARKLGIVSEGRSAGKDGEERRRDRMMGCRRGIRLSRPKEWGEVGTIKQRGGPRSRRVQLLEGGQICRGSSG